MAQHKREQGEREETRADESGRDQLARRPSSLSGDMSTLAGNPFRRMLAEMEWMFDQMQRSFFGDPWSGGVERMFERAPRFDLEETSDAIMLRAEIPGVEPEDLHIEFRDGIVTLRGETRREEGQAERGGQTRSYASFYRQIALPSDADADHAQASYRHGLVTIRFPKTREQANVKRIPITSDDRQKQERAA